MKPQNRKDTFIPIDNDNRALLLGPIRYVVPVKQRRAPNDSVHIIERNNELTTREVSGSHDIMHFNYFRLISVGCVKYNIYANKPTTIPDLESNIGGATKFEPLKFAQAARAI